MMIDGIGARLHHKHVRAANILQNLKINLAVAEAAQLGASHVHAQVAADALSQFRVRASGKDLELFVDQIRPPSYNAFRPCSARRRQGPTKRGYRPCAKACCKGRPGLPETNERIGAPALGLGIFQTPPNRYPPARLPQLLPGAIPGEYERGEGTAGRRPSRSRSRDDPPAGSSTERRNSIV